MRGDPDQEEEAAGAGFDLSQRAGLTRSKATIIESANHSLDSATFLDVNITVGALGRSIYGFATRVPTVASPELGSGTAASVLDLACQR